MKITIKSVALVSAVSLLAACGDEASDSSVSQNYHDITTTLQGSVFNALDNSRNTDEELTITLVQGTKYREDKVITGNDEHAGDYSLNKIPTSTAGNIAFRMTTTATGYQPFEAIVAFPVTTNGLQDEVVNRIGNIYMYPLGTNASDVTVNVTFNNEPVANATVLLNPNTANNLITTDSSIAATVLNPSNGLQEAQTATTNASGVATFAAASLVLGGRYQIDVMPTTYEGTQLQVNRGVQFTVGAATTMSNVAMAEAVPGAENGLYVTSASNSDADSAPVTNGVLTFNFSRAISLVREQTVDATLTSDNAPVLAVLGNVTTPTTPVSDSRVTAVVTNGGRTLTLTPNFSTNPVIFTGSNSTTADDNLVVTYSNVQVRLADANDSNATYDLGTDLVDATGANPSLDVQVTADF
jgi:hypothetical protein